MRADLYMRQMKQQIRWTHSWPDYCSPPLNATCMTGGIHLLNHHSSHPLLNVHITALRAALPRANQIHTYIIHLGWLSWHTETSRDTLRHNTNTLDLWKVISLGHICKSAGILEVLAKLITLKSSMMLILVTTAADSFSLTFFLLFFNWKDQY